MHLAPPFYTILTKITKIDTWYRFLQENLSNKHKNRLFLEFGCFRCIIEQKKMQSKIEKSCSITAKLNVRKIIKSLKLSKLCRDLSHKVMNIRNCELYFHSKEQLKFNY